MNIKLTWRQRKAALEVATGSTNDDVAEVIGCHRNTIVNWKRQPEFRFEIQRLRNLLREQARREEVR